MIDYGNGIYLDSLDKIHPDEIMRWRNTPHIYEHCRQHDLLAREEHWTWYQNQLRGNGKDKMYAIFKKDTPPIPIGVCGLTNIDWIDRRAEFSLYIAKEHQGNRLGRISLITLLNHGFDDLGFNTIWGDSFEFNPARKLFKELGMTEDGKRRQHYFKEGQFIDSYIYCITQKEWEERRKACF